MKNLLQKISSKLKRNNPKIERYLDADEIKPIFFSLGVDIENIGFPYIETRHQTPVEAYWAIFHNVKINPVKINDKVSTIITGKYETQVKASYQDHFGDWHPGNSKFYNFEIKEGKLELK